jgi:hypothetical protein
MYIWTESFAVNTGRAAYSKAASSVWNLVSKVELCCRTEGMIEEILHRVDRSRRNLNEMSKEEFYKNVRRRDLIR